MGGGSYLSESRTIRYASKGITDRSSNREIFKETNINSAMNPYGVMVRESCDSEEHPESVPIIIALDVTGSMGSVPNFLIKKGLPNIMDKIIESGVKHPQVLFLAIGDHECDRCPLQVGQFESSDELLDHWFEKVYLESGGGGNEGESYALAWYFATNHTKLDSLIKRGKKGLLFTIGDEPCLKDYPKYSLDKIMGKEAQAKEYTSKELFNLAKEKYEVRHIHVRETGSGSRSDRIPHWQDLIGENNLLIAQRSTEIADIISAEIIKICNSKSITQFVDVKPTNQMQEEVKKPEKEDEILL